MPHMCPGHGGPRRGASWPRGAVAEGGDVAVGRPLLPRALRHADPVEAAEDALLDGVSRVPGGPPDALDAGPDAPHDHGADVQDPGDEVVRLVLELVQQAEEEADQRDNREDVHDGRREEDVQHVPDQKYHAWISAPLELPPPVAHEERTTLDLYILIAQES